MTIGHTPKFGAKTVYDGGQEFNQKC